MFQDYDAPAKTKGVRVGKIGRIHVLGYADDVAMPEDLPDTLTERLNTIADAAIKETDMYVKLKKAFSKIVEEQEQVSVATLAEVKAVEDKYKFPCSFCNDGYTARFKTDAAMQTHRISCTFNYATTDKAWEVEEIRAVFGRTERKLFLVKWADFAEDHPEATSWQPEHLLHTTRWL